MRLPTNDRVQGFVVAVESHPVHRPKTDVPMGVAVNVTGVPLTNC